MSFSQNINMTSKEIETKDRIQCMSYLSLVSFCLYITLTIFVLAFIPRKKKRDSSKLWIVENIFSEESPSKQKNPKEESKGECSIDL